MSNGRIVLSLCDHSGVMVQPWLAAGYECWIVDILHPAGETREGNLVRVGRDIRTWLPPRREYQIAFAAPPCTHLAVSGARWFKGKGLRAPAEAIELVAVCAEILEWTDAPYFLENPVSTLSTYWRKPDYTFDPCDYGGYRGGDADNYRKKTCGWAGNGFVMPDEMPIEPEAKSRIHYMPPSDDRGQLRSVAPAGFARAAFEANCPLEMRKAV